MKPRVVTADETIQDPIDLSDVAAVSLPPEALEADEDELVLHWDAVLEDTDYFALMRLDRPVGNEPGPSDKDVKDAFHAFALAFHPDRYRGAPEAVHAAANRVYMRGAEAYRVLQDPLLRKRYARQVANGEGARMKADEIAQSLRPSARDAVEKIEDAVRSAAARPFAVRADELVATGDLKQARLQLQLALMKEPQNARLQERMRDLDEMILKKPTDSRRG
jgi:curved DNA-binding protein CbpA